MKLATFEARISYYVNSDFLVTVIYTCTCKSPSLKSNCCLLQYVILYINTLEKKNLNDKMISHIDTVHLFRQFICYVCCILKKNNIMKILNNFLALMLKYLDVW